MKKIGLLVVIMSIVLNANAQQIGNGYATEITDYNARLLSGNYGSLLPQPGFPDNDSYNSWTYLYVLRHPAQIPSTNLQLQIASSVRENDRLFFRKIEKYNGESANSSWHELATRASNTFNGTQNINGNIIMPQSKSICIGNQTGHHIRVASYYFRDNDNWSTNQYDHGAFIDFYDNLLIRAGYDNSTLRTVMRLLNNGNVGIGTVNPQNKLDVNGIIRAKEVKVETGWADFVFNDDYRLKPLSEVNAFIQENKHLPEIPSATEIKENEGVNLGEMQVKLLQKIEELTLYIIQQEKRINELEEKMKNQ
jgi:hypothetical protein